MEILWQYVVIVLAVSSAVVYLVVHFLRRRKRGADCASCPTMKVLQRERGTKAH